MNEKKGSAEKKATVGAVVAGAVAAAIFYFLGRRKPPGPEGEIDLSNLTISPSTVYPGETVTISVLAINNNTVSTLSKEVTLGGDFMASQTISLAPGASQTVSFTVTPIEERTYVVSVDGLSGTFVCTAEPHSDIRAVSLDISPAFCYVGDTVTISVTVTNFGDSHGVKTIICDVN